MTKPLCERQQSIDIRQLKRAGMIADYAVEICVAGSMFDLSFTPCHLGGTRPWFCCPGCGRSVAILYWLRHWSCRRCHGLAYAGENETRLDRRLRKIFKARKFLQQNVADGGLSLPFPGQPKWMRVHTYLRLRRKAMDLEAAYYSLFMASLPWRGSAKSS